MARPLTVEEIKSHPEYKHTNWDLPPREKAHVTVAQSRGGPFKLAYELHGHGPHKILWIMGLGGWMKAWQRQTKDFGHSQADQYSSLVFDNRGIGESDKPLLRYTTSEMARDVMELLEHVGWTELRSVHIVGISMGGMIAQELVSCDHCSYRALGSLSIAARRDEAAVKLTGPHTIVSRGTEVDQIFAGLREVAQTDITLADRLIISQGLLIPTRICSLNLISTAPRIVRTLPYVENLRNRINLMMPKSLDEQISKIKYDCYSSPWLALPDEAESTVQPFPTNGDRVSAGEIAKRTTPGALTRTGFLCQLAAAGFHHKNAEQLKRLGDLVGRKRILVLHGTEDRMIDYSHGEMLLRELGGEEAGITKSFHVGLGHVAPIEKRAEFRRLIEDRIEKTAGMGKA